MAARKNIIRYNNLRRQHVGNIGIVFFAALRTLLFVQLGHIARPANLIGVDYWTEVMPNGTIVHCIRGIDILAQLIVTLPARFHTHGAYLMNKLRGFGVIQHIRSAMFNVSNAVANQLYRDNNAVFAVFQETIGTLENVDPIQALRQGGRQNDVNYRRANQPGYYIGDDNRKLNQRAAREILGGSNNNTSAALRALMTRYVDGGRRPVSDEIQDQLVTVRT